MCRSNEGALPCLKLPEFLANTGFKNREQTQTIFKYAHDTPLGMFQWLQQHPKRLNNFNVYMSDQQLRRVDWFHSLPMDEIMPQEASSKSQHALLIDVSGDRGHDLEAFRKRYPDAAGKLILQELPGVIADIEDLDESIERMGYNFFDAQPVIGKQTPCLQGKQNIVVRAMILLFYYARCPNILLPLHFSQPAG